MNNSSLNQTQLTNPKQESSRYQLKKKKAPISLITSTQAIFIKNKLGDIAASYIDGSLKIQKQSTSTAGTSLLKNNHSNQPTAPIQRMGNLMKHPTKAGKTIQTTISSNQRSSHSIANSFTSKMSHFQLKDVASKEKKENDSSACAEISRQPIGHNVLLKMSLKNKNEVSLKSFVDNLDKLKAINGRFDLKEKKMKKVFGIAHHKKPSKKAETVSITLRDTGKNANASFRNHKCLYSIPDETTSITMPSRIEDSHLTQKSDQLYSTTYETEQIAKKKDKDKGKDKKDNSKVSELKFTKQNGNKALISINLGHTKLDTSSTIATKSLNTEPNEKPKANDKDKAPKPKNGNSNALNLKPDNDKRKAPKCPIQLNLLSLIQENKIKLKKEKESLALKSSLEDIEAVLHTDPELLDTKRYKEFDNYDDVNSIIKKIHFEKVNKKSISIFTEDNTVYQLYNHKFNEKFTNQMERHKKLEQRTNASGSTCENSSKKLFAPLVKCVSRKNDPPIEIH